MKTIIIISILIFNISVAQENIMYSTYVQDVGWTAEQTNGSFSGTVGKSKRIEAIKIKTDVPNLSISYKTYFQDKGWLGWLDNNSVSGFPKKGLQLEAIAIKLNDNTLYSVEYKVHVQNVGWMEWVKEVEVAGTIGKSQRLEAIQIKLIKKKVENKKENVLNDYDFTGEYSFFEEAGGPFWDYNLNVSMDNAKLCIDGHMTLVRIECSVKTKDDKASFYFKDAIDDDMSSNNIYKEGDLLFELLSNGKNVITNWKKLQPSVISNNSQGKVRFEKKDNTSNPSITFPEYANSFVESYINDVSDFISQCEVKIEAFDFDKGKNIKESPNKSYEYLKYFFAFKNYKISENIIEFTDGEYTVKLYFRQDATGSWKLYKYDGIA